MKRVLLSLIALLLLAGCTSTDRVSRVDADEVIDLSGRWNDTDSRLVSEEMIGDLLSRRWIDNFYDDYERRPVIIVGSIRNKSSEHINVTSFVKDIEREIVNSGVMKVVASSEEREGLRDEKEDQQSYSSIETAKRLAQETGADIMLIGSIITIEDKADDLKVIYYQVDMELVELESNEKLWIGTKKHKKVIELGGSEW